MDVSVRHLNHRMSVQVPASLPLGLVFVVGHVANWQEGVFDLVENGYRLRCQRTDRIDPDLILEDGDRVRAGGHLTFDATTARYLLVTRDIERLIEPKMRMRGRSGLSAILKDIKKRADVVQAVNAEMPNWVKQLAPSEVRSSLAIVEDEVEVELEPIVLNEQMVVALSQAMDSDEDVELTSELLVKLAEEAEVEAVVVDEMPANISAMYEELPEPPAISKPVPAPARNQIRETVFILFTLLLIITLITVVGVVIAVALLG